MKTAGVLTFYTVSCKMYRMRAYRRKTKADWNSDSIQGLRQHLGLTQQQLADELGIRQQTISEWETGMYRPRGSSSTLLTIVAERAGFRYEVNSSKKGQDTQERAKARKVTGEAG